MPRKKTKKVLSEKIVVRPLPPGLPKVLRVRQAIMHEKKKKKRKKVPGFLERADLN